MIRILRFLTTTALATSAGWAAAQATAQDEAVSVDEEIVVTAQRVEQNIVDVPITLSAITGRTLADIGVSDLDEVANFIPGLIIQEQSANNPGFVIRGITSDNGSSQQGARVTLYYNGIDISRSRGAYQDLYDLDRIEVVKGPQSTLFGTAAAVGAIGLVSARPRAGASAELTGAYGNFDRYQTSGYVNLGNNTLAGRIAFAYKRRDGYVRDIAGDPDVPNQNQAQPEQRRVNQADLNGQDQRSVRGSLRWRPADRITAGLVLTYDGQRNPDTAFKSRALPPTGGFNAFLEKGFQRVPFSTEEGTYLAYSVSPAFPRVRQGLAAAGLSGCVAPDGTVTAARATSILTGGAATAIPYSSVFQNNGRTTAIRCSPT